MTVNLDPIYLSNSQLFKTLVYDADGVTEVTPSSCVCSIWNIVTGTAVLTNQAGTVGSGYAQYNWVGSATAGSFQAVLTVTISSGVIKSEHFFVDVLSKPPAGASVEPVTIAMAKAFLRVEDDIDDALIAALIQAAREKGESLSRRAFLTQTLTQVLDAWPGDYRIVLRRPPLLSVTSVKYTIDGAAEASTWTDYSVDIKNEPGVIHLNSVPNDTLEESGAIVVTYTAGYGAAGTDVPEVLRLAMLMLVAYWYESRDAGGVPENIRLMFVGERAVWF